MMRLRTILDPTDFSECSKAALEMAGALAHDYGAKLVILHVVSRPNPTTEAVFAEALLPQDWEPLRKLLHEVRPSQSGVAVQHILIEGNPVEEILHAAEQSGCDLIVMGTHGRRGVSRLLMGSVAENVSRRATCAVVTTRQAVNATKRECSSEPVTVASNN